MMEEKPAPIMIEEKPAPIKIEEIENHVSSVVQQSVENADLLNPDVNFQTREKIKERFKKKEKAGYVFQNKLKRDMTEEERKKELEKIEIMMIPNPAVVDDVEIMEPITVEQIKNTQTALENKDFHLSAQDPNAIYHVINAIDQNHGLDFVIMDSNKLKRSKDSIEKSVDFALENEVITEDSLFMMGSENVNHQIKGFSLHLQGSPQDLPNDSIEKQYLIVDYKQ
jgi:hypothetical protein